MQRIVSNYNHILEVDPNDLIGREIIKNGIYDQYDVALMVEILKSIKPDLSLDIGANIGNHCLVISDYSEKVLAFEPSPKTFNKLKNNVNLNNVNNITVFMLGLSAKESQGCLYIDDVNAGASSLLKKCGSEVKTIDVRLVNGDCFIDENKGFSKIDFVKIDVEGHEAEVIKGIKQTILKDKPLIILEWNNDVVRHQFKQDHIFETIFPDYKVFGVVSNVDKKIWRKRKFGQIIRRFKKRFTPKRSCLTDFDFNSDYGNIVLIPDRYQHYIKTWPVLSLSIPPK